MPLMLNVPDEVQELKGEIQGAVCENVTRHLRKALGYLQLYRLCLTLEDNARVPAWLMEAIEEIDRLIDRLNERKGVKDGAEVGA